MSVSGEADSQAMCAAGGSEDVFQLFFRAIVVFLDDRSNRTLVYESSFVKIDTIHRPITYTYKPGEQNQIKRLEIFFNSR